MRALAVAASLALMSATPALAERPADILARQRGVLSTNSGPVGSAFPAQYVEAYRFTPRQPVLVLMPPPPLIVVAMPAAPRAAAPAPAPAPSGRVLATRVTATSGSGSRRP